MFRNRKNIFDKLLLSGLLIRTIVLLVIIFSFSSAYLQAQKITKDNYSGEFTDDNSWQNPPSPNLANTAVEIYGDIQHTGDLSFGQNLTIHDTLRIYGDVSLGNNCDLTINPGGIFIVYGNYSSDNHVNVITGGYLIVTGSFSQSGADNQGSFDIAGGFVYIFDPSPQIKEGDDYADLQCDPDCGYGNEEDLQSDPIWSFFEPATYNISASGPTEFCEGGSVTLSVPDDGDWYQWYRDNSEISGANSYSYNVFESGDYHLRMLVAPDTIDLSPVSILVYSNSSPPASAMADRNNICPGDGSVILSYTGGSMGTGATAEWYSDAGFTVNIGSGNGLSISAPLITTTYYVRFEGDCDTTTAASIALTVLPASPVPTISLNAIAPIPINTPSINLGYSAITGSPSLYSITWSGPALSAGFANITDAPLPASPVSITLPVGMEAGQTYTGSLTVKNTCNTSSEYPISISVLNNILGVNPHATVAYSLRKLSPTYTGPAVRVRRSSDNLVQDIGFNAEGNLDEVALLAFTGAVNAYITIWYDQSGNGSNAIQSNSDNQPILVENGVVNLVNGKPMLRFDGTNDLLNYSNPPANNFSIFTLARTSLSHEIDPESNSGTGGTAGQRYLLGAPHGGVNAGQGISFGTNGISNYEHGAGYMPATAVYTGSITGLSQINVIYTNRRPSIYLDGLLVRTGFISGRPIVTASTQIGSGSYGAFNGEIPELIIFPSSLSNTDRQTIVFNQSCHYLLAELTPEAVPGISPDATSASLPFKGGVNQSWTYSITWDAAAIAAGFINIANENLPVTPVSIAVPSGISEGDVFNGTFSAVNQCGTSIPDHPLTIRVLNKILGLDSYSSSAYSLRKIASAYTGPAVRLRRTSDGQLRDVYFDSGETVSLNSPVSGAGGGTPTALTLSGWIGGGSATVRIWYDQSGNVKHATQSTTAAQPLLVSNGGLVAFNTRPMIQFDGVNDLLSYNNPPEDNFSIFTIARTPNTHEIDPQSISGTGGVNNQRYLMGAANRGDDAGQGISLGTNGISNYEHGNSYMPATAVYSGSVTGLNLVDILYNNRRPYIYMNGNLVRTGLVSPKTTVYASYEIGGMNYGYFNGNIPEIIIFPYSVTATERQQIECNQIEYYSIFGPASASIDTNNICPGDGNITLSYSGGNLRAGATAEWYSDSALTVNVGSGNNLSIPAPIENSEYFVRFEGVCNTSLAVSTSITVKELPVKPDTAIVDRSSICPSDGNIVLSFSGGSPGIGGIARWYTDAAFTSLAGTGNDISLPAPAATQTYYIRYEADCGNSPADSVTVIVNPLPVVNFTGLAAEYCLNTPHDTLTGSEMPGGSFFGSLITDLGNGQGIFSPSTTGLHEIFYTFTDVNGCSDTTSQSALVHSLPLVSFTGLDSVYDISEPIVPLTGNPSGGIYFGYGISGNNYNPALAGVRIDTVIYSYTDLNGCTSTDTSTTNVKDYDFREGARHITSIDNWCSVEAIYTTIGATPDEAAGSCWPHGPTYNRWFKFQATTTEIKIEIKTGGTEGTLRRPYVALWDETGNELACQVYYTDYADIIAGNPSLTPGEWYYISVDNHLTSGYRGTFTLCLDDAVDYDFKEGAVTVPHIPSWSSPDAEYSTLQASADKLKGTCWPTGPSFNRWFRFQATSAFVTVEVGIGGSKGNLRRPMVALWDESDNQLACARYYTDFDNIKMGYSGLVPGTWYYISVDNHQNTGYRGSFTLNVNNTVDYDFPAGAIELTDLNNWCSSEAEYSTVAATPDGDRPTNWNSGPNYNRWFTFRATTEQVRVEMKTGGSLGTLRNGLVAIWDSAFNEINSARYTSEYSAVSASSTSLIPGGLYYISVDNYHELYRRGTFTLCLTDVVDYDFKEAALELTSIDDWCSPQAIYTTLGATPDREKGSLWPNGPNYNRWFKFNATTNQIKVELRTGGDDGTLRYGMIALWDSADNEIKSARYNSEYSHVVLSSNALNPGEAYWISVDNHDGGGYRGTFSLCVSDTLDYDFKEAAVILTDLNTWCSAEAAYTTIGATPDEEKGSAWNNGPNYNRWFRFQATKPNIKIDLKTGGTEGSLRYPFLALWDSAGNEIKSIRYTGEYSDISVSSTLLSPGDWYYISADNHTGNGYRGTFTLCVTDTIDYDYKEAAIEITNLEDWCSANAAYTTIGATPDRLKGSIWNNGPNYNRWFKFQATNNQIKIDLKTGGAFGSLRYPFLAIWNEDDTEIASTRYTTEYSQIFASSDTLTPGNWYYVSVDNHDGLGYRGTFTLCATDTLDYDYKVAAVTIPHTSWCSVQKEYSTLGATPDEQKGSVWPSGPNYNRWFKFQAVKPWVKIDMKTGGDDGTLQYPYLALWDSAGNEIASSRYYFQYQNITVSAINLVPGEWYYISADNHNSSSYRGSFTLCIEDTVDYDFKEAPVILNNINNWCSPSAAYTTIDATADGSKGIAWANGPNHNRWFKFQATGSLVKVDLKIGGADGTLRYPFLAIWNENFVEVASSRYIGEYNSITASSDSLTPGNWYYISVDNSNSTSYRGTFSLCVTDTLDYDYKLGAVSIPFSGNWCSEEAEYTTLGATPDESRPGAWPTGPNNNRWFNFRAASNGLITVILKTGGTEGSLRYPYLALWDSAGIEIASARYSWEYDDISVGSSNLNPGELYYVSVDNHNSTSYQGSFTLCLKDTIDYDFRSGAIEVPHIDSWCSTQQQFTTTGATPDALKGSCWSSGPNYNRWFSFRASTEHISLRVLTGGSNGTIQYPLLALWDSAGNQIECRNYTGQYNDLELTSNNFTLTPGELYYISVDNHNNISYRGTFTLCIENKLSYDFKAGAYNIPDITNWCSDPALFTTLNATPDEARGSCLPNGPSYNRWFRFQATSNTVSAQLRITGIEGTLRRPYITLWTESLVQVSCGIYSTDNSDVEIYSEALIPGQWYYISVDNWNNTAYRGTFSLCVTDNIINDNKSGAILLNDLNSWCSADAKFTNSIATSDETEGSCWAGTDNKNVWFSFIANSALITIDVKTGGILGQMSGQQIALWDDAGNEIECTAPLGGQGDLTLVSNALTPGNLYYISVDDNEQAGTFTLCLDDDVNYDYPQGAYELTDLSNWCSPDAAFSNSTATADAYTGSCWLGTPSKIVWFKFQANTPEIKVSVTTGGAFGNMQRQQMAIWNSEGTEVACAGYVNTTGTVIMQSDSLTVGNWYWIGVDDNSVSGSFTLCIDENVDFDFRQAAHLIDNISLWCSNDAEFSNRFATPDHNQGSCWTGTANKNVWFTFVATTPFIRLQLKTGGVYGAMTRQQMAVFNSSGTEIGCARYINTTGTIVLQLDTLTAGDQYWISVDDDQTSGTFTLCTDDRPDYDYKEGAKLITNLNNWCSGEAVYSNYYATPDESMGSCWSGTLNKNVWFKFQATTRFMTITNRTAGVYGSMRYPQMALWNEEGTEVQCKGPYISSGTAIITIDTLTPGNWYYLSVDDNNTPGSFSLCFNDQPTYDYKEGARLLNHNGGCSMDAEFSNFHATADQSMGSCWSGTENKNVWFTFQATTPYLTLSLRNGTVYGSMRRAQISLWQADGTEIKCTGPVLNEGTTNMSADNLIPGEWYYISVDDNNTPGSFTLCIEDQLSYDYKAGAMLISNISNWCSPNTAYTNFFATPDENIGSCWAGTENKNVWFKFQATNRFVTVNLRSGTIYGGMRRPQMALWNESGDEVQCVGAIAYEGNVQLNIDTLTPGNWYYLSVDDNYTSGSFSLCFNDQPGYDYKEGAIELIHDQGCSANQAYSNFYATPDQSTGSCWGGTLNKNVWFKFLATTNYLTLRLRTGTVYGSMRRAQAAIWTESGSEVKCLGPVTNEGTSLLSLDNLTIGDWYYISVDDNNTSGTFTLCIDDELDFDYWEGAKILDHNAGCSSNAAYTNFYATDDEAMGPCWSGTENKNVWFIFLATSPYATVSLRSGNVYGNLRRGQMALWNAGKENVKCVGPVYDYGTNIMSIDSLTAGEWYWISVDDNLTSGTFTLCLSDQPDYDYKAGAKIIPHAVWCSSNQEYTNAYATEDETMAPCWSGTVNKNVWFKFQATGSFATIEVKTGTIEGTMRRAQAAIWNENGDLVKCVSDLLSSGSTSLSVDSLTSGNWYYISVDDNNTPGTFALCMSNQVDYDYKAGAMDIIHNYGCYPELAFSNLLASPDGNQGSCWTGTNNKNVWFRFQAISPEVRVEIRTGTIYGAMRTAQASIWNEAGTEISCNRLTSAGFMLVQSDSLTPGNWYYISVDDDQTSGSFTLCIGDEVDYDYRNGAIELNNISKWCSVDAAYTNAQATPDRNQGSCWTGTANKNVWFTFTAETRNAIISVLTGNVYGTMRRQQIALWNADGVEIGCARLAGTTGTLSLSVDTLTTGNQYWISVDDDNASGDFTLCVNGNPLDADITGSNISCGETSNGSITVSPMGGSGAGYTYSWTLNGSPFPFTTPVLTNLSAGDYEVTVTDAGDGTSVIRSITLIQIPALSLSLSKTDETCAGNSDASITVTAGGGTLTAYLYTWAKDGVAISDVLPVLTNQSEGWYRVTIQDAVELSCLKSDSIEVLAVKTISTNPSGIDITNNDICQGTPKTLTVNGGSLGTGANWKWYLNDSFTSSAGPDGLSLIVDPAVNTTYWVRAEGDCNTTLAVTATVLTGLPSIAPTSASADRNNICPGDGSIILSYSGGSLGDGATAEWYSDPAFTLNIGSGNNLTIPAPLNNSSYFVRFEGDCNITSAVSTSINLLELPVAPDTAIVDRPDVCPSDGTIVLSYSGGTPGAGGVANWYSDAGFANLVGTGNNLNIPAPATTQTYYIRYEADCGNSLAKSVTVTVNPLPSPAVNGPAEVCSPGSGTFSTSLNTGHSYTWTISGGAVIGPADENEITLDFAISGVATLQVTERNDVTGCESVSTVYNVNIIETPVVNEIQSDRKLIER